MCFARNRKCAAELRAQERKKPSRIISLLLVISMLCGNFVGLPTVASEVVAYCGLEEHTHSDACYQAVQVAGETTPETLAADAAETTAPTEAALVLSGGSDAQTLTGAYVEKEQCCGKEEHKHSLACYSNPEADLETAAIWEATLPEKLSGDWGKDLAEVAKSQLGYAESAANYLVGADGETLMGYSRYGAWYSSYTQDEKQAYADWNVPFMFFCLYYAGVEDFPIEENCADWTASLAAAELWRDVAGEYIPEAGDLVFLDTDEDGAADRAAVVTEWDEAKVTAVESDSEGAVKSVTYDLTEDTQVLGYGDTNEAQEKIEVSGGEDAPELLNNTTFTIYFAAPQSWTGYKVKYEAVLGDNGSTKNSDEMSPTGETYTSENGTTYNIYKAENVYEKYGGFDELYFHKYEGDTWKAKYTVTTSWLTKETMENMMWLPNSTQDWDTNTDGGSWVAYDPDDSGGGGGSYSGPLKVGDTIYLDIGTWSDGNQEATFRVQIGDNAPQSLTHVSGNIYSITIPDDASLSATWRFRRDNPSDGAEWNYASTTLPTDGSDCFKITGWSNGNTNGTGTWSTYSSGGGGGTVGNVVDINSEAFSPADDTYYVNASFYDYYTDFEVNGTNRDDHTGTIDGGNFPSHDNWIAFRQFNSALSAYYDDGVKFPLYVGHFQPHWGNDNSLAFRTWAEANSYTLYGFEGNRAYGASDNDQKWFMSVNNSRMDLSPTVDEMNNDTWVKSAAQGLVRNELDDDGNLMSIGNNSTAFAMPLGSVKSYAQI